MKKLLIFLLPIVLALFVFFGFLLFLSQQNVGKGALQVTSHPTSNVYINGGYIGQTPLCKCDAQNMLPTGEYTIRMVPTDPTLTSEGFEQKITVNKSVLTVVDRNFAPGALSDGSIISLVPQTDKTTAGLFVESFPDQTTVSLDGNQSGQTPLTLANIVESDHTLSISKSGYSDKDVRIHTVKGYTLSVVAFLSVNPNTPSSTPSAQLVASSAAAQSVQMVIILDTPTGFLRVHKEASISSLEITQVKPTEQYPLISQQAGWYQIKLTSGALGWISSTYAKIQ